MQLLEQAFQHARPFCAVAGQSEASCSHRDHTHMSIEPSLDASSSIVSVDSILAKL